MQVKVGLLNGKVQESLVLTSGPLLSLVAKFFVYIIFVMPIALFVHFVIL